MKSLWILSERRRLETQKDLDTLTQTSGFDSYEGRSAFGRIEQLVVSNIMTSHSEEYILIVDICACVKRLVYGASQIVRVYGEEFEVISDPFADAGGIAITVRTKKDREPLVLQIPATILQSVKGHLARAA